MLHQASGAQLRAQTREAIEGERSTAYFLRKERVRGQQRLIHAINRPDGSTATAKDDILHVWRDSYYDLFSSRHLEVDHQQLFLDPIERRLSAAESRLCDGPLTFQECLAALSNMPASKSPGIDGFPAEFYRKFWDLLGPDLVDVFNFCYDHGSLPQSLRKGAITLLYKKGDCLDAKNWRPITLLCADYKIAAKALANRLLLVISSVVSPDQSCGIPGRFSGENIRLLQDVADFADRNGIGGAIVSLDQEKAFDCVEHSYMLKVLERMGFGSSFRQWISLLYTHVYSAVSVNGFLTEFFPVTRGVRQGCPLSPLLYVLVMESMACAVRADPDIDGFPLPGGNQVVKLSQYADDTSCLVASDASPRALFDLFAKYELASGARLNRSKCCGLLLRPWRSRSSLPIDLRWSSTHIVVLGAKISPNASQDWDTILKSLELVFSSWQSRNLSYRGRALVASSLGVGRLWYLASVVPFGSDLVSRVNQLAFRFIWNNQGEWLSRLSVCLPLRSGGLGMVHLDSKLKSLRVMWVKRFLVGPPHPWKSFFRHFLRRAFLAEPVERVFLLRTYGQSTLRRLPRFYQSVLQAWLRVGTISRNANSWAITSASIVLDLQQLTSRIAYRLLRPVHHPRCLATFAAFHVDWPNLWACLELVFIDRAVWKTNRLVAHGILPTCDRLSQWGVTANHLFCHCGVRENQHHVFVECALAQSMFDWLEQLLSRLRRPSRCLFMTARRFCFPASESIPAGFQFLLACIRHYLWVARNAWQFEDRRPVPERLREQIIACFKYNSQIQFQSRDLIFYNEQWLADGILRF